MQMTGLLQKPRSKTKVQLVSDKHAKAIQWKKEQTFNKWYWTTEHPQTKKKKKNPKPLTLYEN